tara:strand:- start:3075 stop:4628 length:1554 start_codon:yes stop_codon:yes gene_type:complete
MYTNQNDPLSQQLNAMNDTFQKSPALAQKYASIPKETMETLVAKRVVNEFAKQNRKLQEEAFVGRVGNPNSTVNDDLKTEGVRLSQGITNLELDKAQAAGDMGRMRQMDQQNALNKLVAANKKSPTGGIGSILNNPNAAPAPIRGGGVPTLAANNMRNMPVGGIAPPAAPMRAAQGGLVSFSGENGSLVEGNGNPDKENNEQGAVVEDPVSRVYEVVKNFREDEEKAVQDEIARIENLFKDKPKTGYFSDDLVQRMIDFGGARSLSEGIRQSSSLANQREAAERKEMNELLAGVRKDRSNLSTAALQAAIASSELGLNQKKLEQDASQFKDTLGLDKLKLASADKQFILGLDNKQNEFNRTLEFQVNDANVKNEIKQKSERADAVYKDAMIQISKMNEINKATSLAMQISQLKQNFIDSQQVLLRQGGVTGGDLVNAVDGVIGTYLNGMEQILGQSPGESKQEISDLAKKGESVKAAFGNSESKITIPEKIEIDEEIQRMTDEMLNKKRGGIISLAR